MTRQIFLDVETTGLDAAAGDRVIEVGCVELIDRRPTGNNFYRYLDPERPVDPEAAEVHGMTWESLVGQPTFDAIAGELHDYLGDAALVIHNAPFDVGFLDSEFLRVDTCHIGLADRHAVIDTLADARQRYPGQRNGLDALCTRLGVDNSSRELHGALLDAEILADVYRQMTGGQVGLELGDSNTSGPRVRTVAEVIAAHGGKRPRVVRASDSEQAGHQKLMATIEESSGSSPVWNDDDTQSLG
jgi:DNA polymerase-3 subunit epsilon